jgi:hypothetical protein
VPIDKVVIDFCYLLPVFPSKVDAVISFFVEQQDAPVVKYSAASIGAVIYCILIEDHDARHPRFKTSMMHIVQVFQKACSYRIEGSSHPHCTVAEFFNKIDDMERLETIVLHKFKDGEIYCELPAFMIKNIGRHREINYRACNRSTVDQSKQAFIDKTKNKANLAYEEEKKKQNAAKGHHVYYIQWDNDPGFVKIGYSSSPVGRITGFLTGSPRSLRLLRLEPVASAREEAFRHVKFNEYRHAREWFRYEGTLKKYVQSLSVDPAIKLWEQFPAAAKDAIKVEYF